MAMHLEFVVQGPPISNQQSNAKGRANLTAWKATIAGEVAASWAGQKLTAPLRATIINFHNGNSPSVDVDNMSKPIFDEMQKLVYDNDRQIRQAQITHLEIGAPFSIAGVSKIIVNALQAGVQFVYVRSKIRLHRTLSPREIMNTQQQLDRVADRYREQGYQVVMNPGPDVLPPFAQDFKVEILAKRPDGNVLVSAKASSSDFERDPNLANYAEIIEKHRGWRYDVTVLGPPPPAPPLRNVDDASEAQIAKALDDAERLFGNGFAPQAVLTAWSALESAMRHRLRALGGKAGYGTSPRSMLNELISAGEFSHSEFRDLEGLSNLRNIIVHGFSVPEIGQSAVSLLADTTRKLLAESKPVEQAS